jgi:hypothetical protein
VHRVPGTHLTIFREPHVAVLARTLGDCIARARAEGRTRAPAVETVVPVGGPGMKGFVR